MAECAGQGAAAVRWWEALVSDEASDGSRIDAYLDAMDFALSGVGDFQPRPFHIVEVTPYFLDLEAVDMLARLRRLDEERVPDEQIGRLFPGANAIKTLLMDIVCGLKSAGVPRDDRVYFTERMFDAMAAVETGDIFCRDGGHRLLTAQQAQDLVNRAGWSTDRDLVKAAFRASASGQAMVWALYFYAWTDMGWEIHGPYEVRGPDGSRALLVVRDYFDLAPSELWPEVAPWPLRTMRLVSLHDPDPEICIDVLNHVWYDASWPLASRAVELRVDDVVLGDVAAVREATQGLAGTARKLQVQIAGTERVPLLHRFATSRYYALRAWRQRFGDDWRPPQEVYDRIVAEPFHGDLAETGDPELLRLAFDPRSDVLN
jgi:hypothetical protein